MSAYAIVKTGGKQYKVSEGETVTIEKLEGAAGDSVTFPAVLVVENGKLTSDAQRTVSAEIVEHTKGPKIKILRYKNKTGYKRRQGHRQPLTVVKVTKI